MDKHLILEKYRNSEEKLLISKLFDKIEMVNKSNKIETTDFLNEHEQNILKNVLNIIKFENYVFSGGIDNSDRKTVVIGRYLTLLLFYVITIVLKKIM